MYKIIATDLDDTLLTSKKQVTNFTKETFIKYKEKGYITIAVTARPLGSLLDVADKELFNYLVLNNGSYVYDVDRNTGYYNSYISHDIAIDISKDFDLIAKQMDFNSYDAYYVYKDFINVKKDFVKNIESLKELPDKITKINIFLKDTKDIKKHLEDIKKKYKDVNSFIMQDSRDDLKWLVINPKGVNKLSTLTELAKSKNIDISEIIFFGDGTNDLEIIENVGLGVAVSNALPEVKAKAKDIALSNEEDGVAVYLNNNLK